MITENSIVKQKKDVGMELLVHTLCNLSCLRAAIPTPSVCGFGSDIPLHCF